MQFGLLVAKQHPPGVSMVERFREHLAQVQVAREGGFDLVVLGQHYLSTPFQELQTFPLLARLAAEAGTMRLGATVLLLPLLHPVDVAEQVATLDVICEGRFICGVGLGYREEEYAAFGVRRQERVARFVECLEVVKRLWTEEEVTHRGRFFQLTQARLELKPVQRPHPPLWCAAYSDVAVRRAARLGDTWVIDPRTTRATLEPQLAVYRQTLAEAGKPFPRELPIFREVYVAPDRHTALEECRPFLAAKYQAYAAWGQEDAPAFEDLVRDHFIVGDPQDCIRALRWYAEAFGITCVLCRFQWPGLEQAKVLRSMRLLADHVIPALR